MARLEKINKIIKNYGLKPATKRNLPLLTFDIIVTGYRQWPKFVGFSLEAIGAIGGKDWFQSLLNEEYIVEKTEKFLEKNYRQLNQKIFFPTNKILSNVQHQIKIIDQIVDREPERGLQIVTKAYPPYMTVLGIYNCFWRYLGEEESKGKLTPALVKKIGQRRDRVAKFYPEIEKRIQACVRKIGRKGGFNGELLQYFTLDELKIFLEKQKITKPTLRDLAKRQKGYFYLFVEKIGKPSIITDKNIIRNIYNNFFKVKKVSTLKGHSVYSGKVKGLVYNLTTKRMKPKGRFVLVTTMTHPDDIDLITKSLAIVTDEGGILSHASIVAREMKIPCIIGTKIATQVLKDGDLVEVDAEKGVVRVLKNKIIPIKFSYS
ncbi:MAG: PEP-utilizing enzyme [Patescibacteria group bacterium]